MFFSNSVYKMGKFIQIFELLKSQKKVSFPGYNKPTPLSSQFLKGVLVYKASLVFVAFHEVS